MAVDAQCPVRSWTWSGGTDCKIRPLTGLRELAPGGSGSVTLVACRLPSEVVLEPHDDPISHRSAVKLDLVESVSVGALVERIGLLSGARMRKICTALEVATDCG